MIHHESSLLNFWLFFCSSLGLKNLLGSLYNLELKLHKVLQLSICQYHVSMSLLSFMFDMTLNSEVILFVLFCIDVTFLTLSVWCVLASRNLKSFGHYAFCYLCIFLSDIILFFCLHWFNFCHFLIILSLKSTFHFFQFFCHHCIFSHSFMKGI